MIERLLLIILMLAPALALGGCGGGSYGGDLYIDGTRIEDTPSLSRLEAGLGRDENPQPYSENPLLRDTQQ